MAWRFTKVVDFHTGWWVDCNPQALWWKTQIFGAYDGDTDGRITKEEFRQGYEKLGRCCGGGCPQWSWCGVLEDEVFPSVDNTGTLLMGSNVITQGLFLRGSSFSEKGFIQVRPDVAHEIR